MAHHSAFPHRRVGSAASALALLAALFTTAAAQQPASPPAVLRAQPTLDERSPLVAGLLQAALPPLPVGYLYACSFARGLIPMGVMVVGTSIFMVESVQIFDWTDGGGTKPRGAYPSKSSATSSAGAECVIHPTEMKSTPVSATFRTLARVIPPEASSRQRPAASATAFRI